MGLRIRRFDIVRFEAPEGEMPCVVVSPDEMNGRIRTLLVAPIRPPGGEYPTRIRCVLEGRDAQVVLDQIRTVEAARVTVVARLTSAEGEAVQEALIELFAR